MGVNCSGTELGLCRLFISLFLGFSVSILYFGVYYHDIRLSYIIFSSGVRHSWLVSQFLHCLKLTLSIALLIDIYPQSRHR
jgi:hypothetical protein